ncbi:MAG: hypothetical protein R3193_18260 [Marinobacter sp.]|nr:hypothetical protein [Marinobacter sp.]
MASLSWVILKSVPRRLLLCMVRPEALKKACPDSERSRLGSQKPEQQASAPEKKHCKMDSQVLPDRWGGLGVETEIFFTKQPNTAALTVVFRVRDAELRRLKPFSATVTTGLYHFLLRFVWKPGRNHPGLSWHQRPLLY